MKNSLYGVLVCGSLLVGCLRPASERVELDRKVGRAEADGVSVSVAHGLAAVRSVSAERVELWAQAPALEIALTSDTPRSSFRIDVRNCMPGAVLKHSKGVIEADDTDALASCSFKLPLSGKQVLQLGPPDAAENEPYAFAVLSDIQRGISEVDDIYERMNSDPELRFVVSTGDLTNVGSGEELLRFQRELARLEIPMFSTVGNHEMGEHGDLQPRELALKTQ